MFGEGALQEGSEFSDRLPSPSCLEQGLQGVAFYPEMIDRCFSLFKVLVKSAVVLLFSISGEATLFSVKEILGHFYG